MSNVLIESNTLDSLAEMIAAKSGEALPLSLSEMIDAVHSIPEGGGGVTPTGNITITQAGVTDVTNYATATVPVADHEAGIFAYGEVELNVSSSGEVYGAFNNIETYSYYTSDGWVNTDYGVTVEVGASANLQLPTQAATTIIPTTSAQTAVAAGKWTTGAVNVAAMPSGSATPAASISGTAATVSTGTNTLTLSKTVSNTPQVSAGYVSSGTAGNTSVSLTASVTTKAAATITPGTTNQTISSGTYLTGAQTISGDANLVAGNIKNGTTIFGVTGTYEGGGSSGMQIATKTTTLDSASASISFSGLSGEPTSFAITTAADLATGASPWKTAAVTFDGTSLNGQIVTNTSNAQASHSTSFTKSYSNGTLTVTGTGTNFQASQYKLVYTYGGTSANLGTDDVQVGSGATSISFTGLSAEPDYFSVIFTSDFSTSSGYQRVMAVVYDGNSTYGVAMDSGAKALSSWSYTYNNGTLTVSSTGTNNGGYFHQPGYYQLTYAYDSSGNYQSKVVTPTTSQQVVQADSGYDALKKVTVNPIPSEYIVPSGNLPITSNGNNINVAQYETVSVNVPTGGGSVNVDTKTITNSSASNTSISFTGLSGEPKAFFVRCTTQLTRSSNSSYYYVTDMRWNGSSGNHNGNYWRMSNGTFYNDTSHYSHTYSNGTLTISSSGSRSSSGGSFYNGGYELVYVY